MRTENAPHSASDLTEQLKKVKGEEERRNKTERNKGQPQRESGGLQPKGRTRCEGDLTGRVHRAIGPSGCIVLPHARRHRRFAFTVAHPSIIHALAHLRQRQPQPVRHSAPPRSAASHCRHRYFLLFPRPPPPPLPCLHASAMFNILTSI
jgi:hypothetical protein